ncbi:hypothetical protein [Actinophytocola glycyrrhizae]|uniref:Alpha/beta hydrolase family protein n=1 Tax=Actinophytocola glycyrrhizae TaxID=2044873 RepID=A0ABV9RYK8_9PSEU
MIIMSLVATGVLACTAKQEAPSPSRGDGNAKTSVTCESQKTREPCSDIVMDGRTWRYAYFPAAGNTAETVVLDFGGPGSSVLSGEAGLSAFLSAFPSIGRRYNVIAIEEPWVTEPQSPECRQAQATYYAAVRAVSATLVDAATGMVERCGLADNSQRWGFDASTYHSLVKAISARHQLAVTGFIGHSWGSVRLSYLDAATLDWAILVRPFPTGTDRNSLIAARAEAMAGLVADMQPIDAAGVPGRSLPVTAFDHYSAVVDLGYLGSKSFDDTSQGVLDGTDLAQIGRLSDSLWKRFGRESLSPGALAQLQETCANIGGVPGVVDDIGSVADVLTAMQVPCQAIPVAQAAPEFATSTCIVASQLDTVTPVDLVRSTWGSAAAELHFVESAQRSHSSFDGLEKCLAKYV